MITNFNVAVRIACDSPGCSNNAEYNSRAENFAGYALLDQSFLIEQMRLCGWTATADNGALCPIHKPTT